MSPPLLTDGCGHTFAAVRMVLSRLQMTGEHTGERLLRAIAMLSFTTVPPRATASPGMGPLLREAVLVFLVHHVDDDDCVDRARTVFRGSTDRFDEQFYFSFGVWPEPFVLCLRHELVWNAPARPYPLLEDRL